jgi:hypothetical protein
VWAVPALMWLVYRAEHRLATITATAWILAIGSYLISFLLKVQPRSGSSRAPGTTPCSAGRTRLWACSRS